MMCANLCPPNLCHSLLFSCGAFLRFQHNFYGSHKAFAFFPAPLCFHHQTTVLARWFLSIFEFRHLD